MTIRTKMIINLLLLCAMVIIMIGQELHMMHPDLFSK